MYHSDKVFEKNQENKTNKKSIRTNATKYSIYTQNHKNYREWL